MGRRMPRDFDMIGLDKESGALEHKNHIKEVNK